MDYSIMLRHVRVSHKASLSPFSLGTCVVAHNKEDSIGVKMALTEQLSFFVEEE